MPGYRCEFRIKLASNQQYRYMQHWQSSVQRWLDTCTDATQALRQSGSAILQALSAQRLPGFEW